MKKLLLIGIMAFFAITAHAQETIIQFKVNSKSELETIGKMVSIDNYKNHTVTAYTNKEQLEEFRRKTNYKFKILPHPSTGKSLTMATTVEEMANWDRYPTHGVYVEMMQNFATDYPDICQLDTIGFSIENRPILAVKISDNVSEEEAEPEVFYTSTMHGDETTGFVLHLRLIDYLLSNYDNDTEATTLVDEMEIWINPNSNPDGTYNGGDNTVSSATRSNANGVDLNRNFKDPQDGDHPDENSWQQENVAMMNFAEAHNFVLSQNTHGGAEVVNYPWDTYERRHADDTWWQYIGHQYADSAQENAPSDYFNGFNDGITNGYDWYSISGGRQDYMNYFHHCREFTLEISNVKLLAVEELPNHWTYNHRALINYLKEANYGIQGIVTNEAGEPLDAEIRITGHDIDNSWVMTDPNHGDYYRPIEEGTFTVEVSAYGYEPQTFNNISTTYGEATTLDVTLSEAATVSISGTVKDIISEMPIEGATIDFENNNIDPATTDSNGTFTIDGILENNYEITVSAEGYANYNNDISVSTDNNEFNFQLQPVDAISFEDGVIPDNFSTSGDADWFIDNTQAYDGTYSVRSGEISDNETSSLTFTQDYTEDSEITFALRTDCEDGSSYYDYLEFFIDGNSQGQWKGSTSWKEVSYNVTEGSHTYKWTFSRDGSVGSGENAAWVDFILVPINEYAEPVASLSETSLSFELSGDTSSKADSLTIKNVGQGTLNYTTLMNEGSWAEITSTEETLAADDSAFIKVVVDGTDLSNGTYYDTLLIVADQAYNIPVSMEIDGVGIKGSVAGSQIYPNPAQDHFIINSRERIKNVAVYNVSGILVLQKQDIDSETIKISGNLEPGVYIVNIKTLKGVNSQKLLIK